MQSPGDGWSGNETPQGRVMFGLTKLSRVTIGPRTQYELSSNMSADAFFAKLATTPKPFAFGLFPLGTSTPVRVKLGTSRFAADRDNFFKAGRLVGEIQSGPEPLRMKLIAELRWNARVAAIFSIVLLIMAIISIFMSYRDNVTLQTLPASIFQITILSVFCIAVAIGQNSMVFSMARRDHDQILKYLAIVSEGKVRSIEAAPS